jgi:hypothetical protein
MTEALVPLWYQKGREAGSFSDVADQYVRSAMT